MVPIEKFLIKNVFLSRHRSRTQLTRKRQDPKETCYSNNEQRPEATRAHKHEDLARQLGYAKIWKVLGICVEVCNSESKNIELIMTETQVKLPETEVNIHFSKFRFIIVDPI